MSLRIAPSPSHPDTTANVSLSALPAPSAPGLADPLRSKLYPQRVNSTSASQPPAAQLSSTHALESRLRQWRSTQQSLRMEGLRRTYGIAEPIRRGMELDLVRAGEWRAEALGGSAGVSGDILEGRDALCEWDEVFSGDESRGYADMHIEMEARLKMI